MPDRDKILERLTEVVIKYDEEKAKEYAEAALAHGVDPVEALNKGILKGMEEVSRKFRDEEIYLPELFSAADAYFAALSVLKPKVLEMKKDVKPLGKVVIGTVEGDIHDIGKNLVAMFLEIAGFEVHDLGKDVPIIKFMEKAKELNADIVASSALITQTRIGQQLIEETLNEAGIKGRVKTIVGGAPVNEMWAEEIGADGYAPNASEAVKVVKRIIGAEK